MTDLEKALKLLGVKGKIHTVTRDDIRFRVYVDGAYFGVWDAGRKTFVD
jgi:hypothetical protein